MQAVASSSLCAGAAGQAHAALLPSPGLGVHCLHSVLLALLLSFAAKRVQGLFPELKGLTGAALAASDAYSAWQCLRNQGRRYALRRDGASLANCLQGRPGFFCSLLGCSCALCGCHLTAVPCTLAHSQALLLPVRNMCCLEIALLGTCVLQAAALSCPASAEPSVGSTPHAPWTQAPAVALCHAAVLPHCLLVMLTSADLQSQPPEHPP